MVTVNISMADCRWEWVRAGENVDYIEAKGTCRDVEHIPCIFYCGHSYMGVHKCQN
jgi:hypothetical protein